MARRDERILHAILQVIRDERIIARFQFAPSGVAVRVAVAAGERPQVFCFVSREAASTMLLAS